MSQMKKAISTAEFKYPKKDGWHHVCVFHHISCHAAMADDALDVKQMNVNSSGRQRVMHDTEWLSEDGELHYQNMNFPVDRPKRLSRVLLERKVDTSTMVANEMREAWSKFSDFKNE